MTTGEDASLDNGNGDCTERIGPGCYCSIKRWLEKQEAGMTHLQHECTQAALGEEGLSDVGIHASMRARVIKSFSKSW